MQVPCHLPVSLCATSASRETQYREHRWRGFVSREGSTFSNARNWFSQVASLEDEALGLLPLLSGGESGTSGVLEDFPDTLVGLGRALDVLLGTNLVLDLSCLRLGQYAGCFWLMGAACAHLLLGDRSLRGLVEFLDGLGIVSKILLATNKDDGKTLAEVKDL